MATLINYSNSLIGIRMIYKHYSYLLKSLHSSQYSAHLADRRYDAKGHLARHGKKVFSQSDEDGIIAEIFERIGIKARNFVEFGVESGLECNSLWLLMQGWNGMWIEASSKHCKNIQSSHQLYLQNGQLNLRNDFVLRDNIDMMIANYLAQSKSADLDLLSIDIDSNDYWIWQAITVVKPRVVVIEYNAHWPPPANITIPYDPKFSWKADSYFGASLGALARLGKLKGYALVGCNLTGVNAFFVRDDLVKNRFYKPGDAKAHYEPPRFHLIGIHNGHPPAFGPVVEV